MKKRKDGRFQLSITLNGKRKTFYSTAETERKAEKDFNKQLLEFKEKEEKGKLFKAVSEEWEVQHYPKISYTTQHRYKSLVRYAVEYFKNEYIKDITPNDISRFIQFKITGNAASKTVSHQLSVINMIFTYACVQGYIKDNPCRYITIPNNLPKKKRGIPTAEEIEIVKSSTDKTFGLLAYFLLFSGLRKGEALALTYSDIDFKNKMINVNKSVYHAGNFPHLKKPKTEAGIRKVILLDCLYEKLNKDSIGLIFHGPDGMLMKQSWFEHGWKHYCEETGLSITAHQLRHAYASYILHDAGIDLKTAQELMGHADISTTQNIYTQITEMRMHETASKLNEFTNKSSQNAVKDEENH